MPHYPTSTLIKRWNKSILISCSFKSPSNRPLTGGLPAWEIYLINIDISISDYELSWNCSKFCPPNLALKTVSLFVIRIFNQWCKLFKIRNTPRHTGLLQGEGLSTSTTCLLSNTGVWNTTGIVVTLLVNSALYPSLHSLAVSFSICYPNSSYIPKFSFWGHFFGHYWSALYIRTLTWLRTIKQMVLDAKCNITSKYFNLLKNINSLFSL